MRILTFGGSGWVLQHSLRDLRAALCGLGHEVYVQDLVKIERGARAPRALDVAIADAIIALEPDAIVTMNQFGLVPHLIAALDRRPRCVSWYFDDPLRCMDQTQLEFDRIAPGYEVFCWDRAYLRPLRERGFARCAYLPLASDPRRHAPPPPGPLRYAVSFVGRATDTRCRWLCALADALAETGKGAPVIDVFGVGDWSALTHPGIRFHGPADNRHDCPEIYARSAINLNQTQAQLATSVPLRVFDVLACGGFLLTDRKLDTPELFEPGIELETYGDVAELARKIRHYLGDPERRERIARAGRARVLREHRFAQRVAHLVRGAGVPPEAVAVGAGPLASSGPDAAFGLWLTGLSLLKLGESARAAAQLERALALLGREPWLLLAGALCASARGDAQRVAALLQELREQGHPLARFAQGSGVPSLGGPVPWELLYAPLGENLLDPRGFVPGWAPVRAAPGPCATLGPADSVCAGAPR